MPCPSSFRLQKPYFRADHFNGGGSEADKADDFANAETTGERPDLHDYVVEVPLSLAKRLAFLMQTVPVSMPQFVGLARGLRIPAADLDEYPFHPVDPLPAGYEEGDPEVSWQQRVQSRFGKNPPQRILDLDATVREHAGSVAVERVLKGEPGWIVGDRVLTLDRVLAMSEGELEVEMLARVTAFRQEEILDRARAL